MTTPPTADLPEVATLRYGVQRLARRIRKQSGGDLTAAQMSALSIVAKRGPLRLGELARREQIGASTMTRLAAGLEELGFVARTSDPADGRGHLLTATERGLDVMREASRRQDTYLAHQLDALTEEHRAVLLAATPAIEALLDLRA
jgi:DNA-binding MarR family transcriptional regulator